VGTGIATVFDALRMGALLCDDARGRGRYARALASEILDMRDLGALKISHYLHLRADLIRVALPGAVPMLHAVWVRGARVA
jgi:alpha-D-ribose 1-methylphosphonate 5-triphosphate diphosphatase